MSVIASPLLTVGMPTYNAAATVRSAIDSLLAQRFGDFELVISDNASTDDTWSIIQEYMQRDARVSLCAYDPDDPYRYFEIRGTVTMTTEGGPELIEELSQRYQRRPYRESNPDNIRVVCRLTPVKVFERR